MMDWLSRPSLLLLPFAFSATLCPWEESHRRVIEFNTRRTLEAGFGWLTRTRGRLYDWSRRLGWRMAHVVLYVPCGWAVDVLCALGSMPCNASWSDGCLQVLCCVTSGPDLFIRWRLLILSKEDNAQCTMAMDEIMRWATDHCAYGRYHLCGVDGSSRGAVCIVLFMEIVDIILFNGRA